MISRRAAIISGAALAASPARAGRPDLPRDLSFRLVRHGSPIGRHNVSFRRDGEARSVRVAVNALVTLFSIPIVRYRHNAVQTWQGGRLVALDGTTDKNGDDIRFPGCVGMGGLTCGSEVREAVLF